MKKWLIYFTQENRAETEYFTMDTLFGDDDSAEIDESIPYRPKTCGVLSFHPGTEEAMLLHCKRKARQGDVEQILSAVDDFCTSRHWMMHVGPIKGSILKREVESLLVNSGRSRDAPLFMVEIGSYCGYSAITMAHHLIPMFPSLSIVCIEGDKKCVQWTQELVLFAGLVAWISVLESTVTTHLLTDILPNHGTKIDVLFIDHDKALYLHDLQLIESTSSLLASGSIVCADNVLSFGKPLDAYLSHVRDTTKYESSKLFESFVEYADENSPENVDGIEISVRR